MDPAVLEIFDRSLGRCNARPGFLDRFYERFLSMSPKVREKFAKTDFVRQKRALRASFHMMLLAAGMRALVDFDQNRFFLWIGCSASAFLVATAVWAAIVFPRVWRR